MSGRISRLALVSPAVIGMLANAELVMDKDYDVLSRSTLTPVFDQIKPMPSIVYAPEIPGRLAVREYHYNNGRAVTHCMKDKDCDDVKGAVCSPDTGICECGKDLAFDSLDRVCTDSCADWCEKPDPLAKCSKDGKECSCKKDTLYMEDANICVSWKSGCELACYNMGGACKMVKEDHGVCICPNGKEKTIFSNDKC